MVCPGGVDGEESESWLNWHLGEGPGMMADLYVDDF